MRVLLSILFVSYSVVYAQIPSAGIPMSANLPQLKRAKVIEMPRFNIQQDKENVTQSNFKTLKFGKTFDVELNTTNSGSWNTLKDGNRIWLLNIKSPGALSLNILFSTFNLPQGVRLFVYNKTKNMVLGAFTSKNNKPWKELPIAPIPGEFITVELNVPEMVAFEPELEIGQVTHDFIGIFKLLNIGEPGSSQECNADISCYTENKYQDVKNSVCRMLANGNELCTGTLMNNPLDATRPYLLTANHCMKTDRAAWRTIFFFNYERVFCDGPVGNLSKTLSGAQLIATNTNLDFSLVKLSVKPPFECNPYYAGWSIDSTNMDTTFSIHHPFGDVKKISFDYNTPDIGTWLEFDHSSFWHIGEWDIGTTEQGSSGCALFDKNGRVIGALSGGFASCDFNYNDFYFMFSKAWNKYPGKSESLNYWLDPYDKGNTTKKGKDPYFYFRKTLSYIGNYTDTEGLFLTKDKNWGYSTGHGGHNITQFAERVFLAEKTNLLGLQFNIAKLSALSTFPMVRIKVWKDQLREDKVILQKDVGLYNFSVGSSNFISFDELVEERGILYFGYEIYTPEITDTFALFHTNEHHYSSGFFVYTEEDGWSTIGNVISELDQTHLSMRLVVSKDVETEVENPGLNTILNVYPNPAGEMLNIETDGIVEELALYTLRGENVLTKLYTNTATSINVDVSSFSPGIYVLCIKTTTGLTYHKISVCR